jgi:transposase
MRFMNAYSEDLRKKIIEALQRGATKSEAARTFGASRSSVKRYAKLVQEGQPLAPKRRPGSSPKMGETACRLLEVVLEERPAATLKGERDFGSAPRNWGKNVTRLASITSRTGE